MNRTNDNFIATGTAAATIVELGTTRDENMAAKVALLFAGYNAGDEHARGLCVGDAFVGAMPAALAAGYARDGMGYKGFILGFVAALPKRVGVNVDGILLAYR